MTSQLDLYRSAAVIVREHEAGAMLEAVMICDRLRQKGDCAGAEVWRAIIRAIEVLEMDAPGEGSRTH